MKKVNVIDILNEVNTFGTCYLANEDIMGWKYIEKLIREITKAARELGTEVYFTTEAHDKNVAHGKDWYAVAAC